ncbi:hypothetical protein [Teredinibacter turnerae]|uniref:hypothetical protein n=1 Tax=Teredinibacter turnerae TaxID=2426 RepID=UPI000373DEF9|nr:hypothetical protein [Teredinibacter turnerae]
MSCSISTVSETPYLCEKALGEDTLWVGFPINISIKKPTFEAALSCARALMDEYTQMLDKVAGDGCELIIGADVENFGEFGETVEFLPSSTGCLVKITKVVIAEFDEKLPFWERMTIVSQLLDKLAESGSMPVATADEAAA